MRTASILLLKLRTEKRQTKTYLGKMFFRNHSIPTTQYTRLFSSSRTISSLVEATNTGWCLCVSRSWPVAEIIANAPGESSQNHTSQCQNGAHIQPDSWFCACSLQAFTVYSAVAVNAIHWIAISCIFMAPPKTPQDTPVLSKDKKKHYVREWYSQHFLSSRKEVFLNISHKWVGGFILFDYYPLAFTV